MNVTETRTYTHAGPNDVATAAELMSKLPNGWTLKSFAYNHGGWDKSWTAVVEGPNQLIERSPGDQANNS